MDSYTEEGFSTVVKEHACNPRHLGPMDDFNWHAQITGPCGDTMEFWIKVENNTSWEKQKMKIAVPVANGSLAMHFGHCETFALFDIDTKTNQVIKREDIKAPPHQPGLLPLWLAERGATVVIAGGMGQRAQSLFSEQGITVVIGSAVADPEEIIGCYLSGSLKCGENICDH